MEDEKLVRKYLVETYDWELECLAHCVAYFESYSCGRSTVRVTPRRKAFLLYVEQRLRGRRKMHRLFATGVLSIRSFTDVIPIRVPPARAIGE
jgi:hypothetical protein